jgi:hypothetical protein
MSEAFTLVSAGRYHHHWLLSLLLPAVQSAQAGRHICANNARSDSVHNFHDSMGYFPPGISETTTPAHRVSDPDPDRTWLTVFILPFVEQQNLNDL